jgi:IS30 family transposase
MQHQYLYSSCMKNHKQLTLKQRCQIQCLLQADFSQVKIASILCVHRSTISRELKRNLPKRERTVNTYITEHAQSKTTSRHQLIYKQILLKGDFISHRTKEL